MTIILDNYKIPEKGRVNIDLHISFEINLTAEQARRVVNTWLLNEVSHMMGTQLPALVLGERRVWRVPVWISFPDTERIEGIGTVDVDVETGKVIDPPGCKAKIEQYLETTIKPDLPPRRSLVHELPPDYLSRLNPPPQVTPQ